jgi:hypothetical protein
MLPKDTAISFNISNGEQLFGACAPFWMCIPWSVFQKPQGLTLSSDLHEILSLCCLNNKKPLCLYTGIIFGEQVVEDSCFAVGAHTTE